MFRTSQHILKYQTNYKSNILEKIFNDYKIDLQYYINLICSNQLPLKKNLSSKSLPTNIIKHSQWKQIIYKQSSEIIRSQIKKCNNKRYNNYKKIYAKCKQNNKHKLFTNKKYSELNLNYILYTKYFTVPEINNISITLDSRLIDFQQGNCFDEFIRVKSPYFIENKKRSITINLPFKHHKHSLKFVNWERKKSIQLKIINDNYYINLFYSQKSPQKKQEGFALGIDQGYKKLLSCSNGQILGTELFEIYQQLTRKQKNSKAYKKLLKHKSNEINRICNLLDINDIKEIVIEDLKNVKKNTKKNKRIFTKTMNKMQYWSYKQTIDKLERLCEENGVLLTKVNPAYTSQTCSNCGCVDKKSRNGESYICQHCGYEIDADLNASINISRMGVYNPHNPINKFH
jgi:IS605 OrfB family transposase